MRRSNCLSKSCFPSKGMNRDVTPSGRILGKKPVKNSCAEDSSKKNTSVFIRLLDQPQQKNLASKDSPFDPRQPCRPRFEHLAWHDARWCSRFVSPTKKPHPTGLHSKNPVSGSKQKPAPPVLNNCGILPPIPAKVWGKVDSLVLQHKAADAVGGHKVRSSKPAF